MFSETLRRDPKRARRWVVLVRAVKAEARRIGVQVTIIVDIVHVLEYVWNAARALFRREQPQGRMLGRRPPRSRC